jgi:hypothetical protein
MYLPLYFVTSPSGEDTVNLRFKIQHKSRHDSWMVDVSLRDYNDKRSRQMRMNILQWLTYKSFLNVQNHRPPSSPSTMSRRLPHGCLSFSETNLSKLSNTAFRCVNLASLNFRGSSALRSRSRGSSVSFSTCALTDPVRCAKSESSSSSLSVQPPSGVFGRDRFLCELDPALDGTGSSIGEGGGNGLSKCVSSERKHSASSGSLWSTTLETSVCRKFNAFTAGISSHISRNLK